ncbi:MAG: pyridoxal-phosphate dependent enzyme [Gemmatimonadota bacterium]
MNTPLERVTFRCGPHPQTLALKLETQHVLRSFKGRGAFAFVSKVLSPREAIVTASAGNFGHALAYAAHARQHPVTVFASTNANTRKLQLIRECGAAVIQHGNDFDAAKVAGKLWARARGLRFVEDGAEPTLMEGAATIAAELHVQEPRLHTLFIPVGNGALAAGIARWYKMQRPDVRIVVVVAAGAPCMLESLIAGKVVSTPVARTIADGVAVRIPVPYALAALRSVVDDVRAVSDTQLLETMRELYAQTKLAVEPSAALGICAALTCAPADGMSAAIVTGANLTPDQFAQWYGPDALPAA